MTARIHFRGPLRYRLRSAAELSQCIVEASARRAMHGPRLPAWNWFVELATEVLQRQTLVALCMGSESVAEARRYLDSVVFHSTALWQVRITPVEMGKFRGSWFEDKNAHENHGTGNTESDVTVLYLHGGGYSFYPQGYADFIALITLAAKSRTFALDYRLAPEHQFPSQLEDAIEAYRWLLANGTDPEYLIVAGDSAGGNLTLALLLAIRDLKLPAPALAIALSPPTDFDPEHIGDSAFDWIEKRMLVRWADWFCDAAERRNPLVSPILADLRGLPPIYIQAGRVEILCNSIQAFADRAQKQGAAVVLETWDDMNHNFQMFGRDSPQSVEALWKIGQAIDVRVRGKRYTAGVVAGK
jgi:acetyl esterase/lipase